MGTLSGRCSAFRGDAEETRDRAAELDPQLPIRLLQYAFVGSIVAVLSIIFVYAKWFV